MSAAAIVFCIVGALVAGAVEGADAGGAIARAVTVGFGALLIAPALLIATYYLNLVPKILVQMMPVALLLARRDELQKSLDDWHKARRGQPCGPRPRQCAVRESRGGTRCSASSLPRRGRTRRPSREAGDCARGCP